MKHIPLAVTWAPILSTSCTRLLDALEYNIIMVLCLESPLFQYNILVLCIGTPTIWVHFYCSVSVLLWPNVFHCCRRHASCSRPTTRSALLFACVCSWVNCSVTLIIIDNTTPPASGLYEQNGDSSKFDVCRGWCCRCVPCGLCCVQLAAGPGSRFSLFSIPWHPSIQTLCTYA